jgi:Tfp pilus assembly protein PilF
LEADPKRTDALILRATARRDMGHLGEAAADIDAACKQDPENADALLERGIIRQRQGDLEGARDDWQKAEDLSPDTATGDLAQQNLALLDAGPRQ